MAALPWLLLTTMDGCKACPDGHVSNINGTLCSPCPTGTYAVSETSIMPIAHWDFECNVSSSHECFNNKVGNALFDLTQDGDAIASTSCVPNANSVCGLVATDAVLGQSEKSIHVNGRAYLRSTNLNPYTVYNLAPLGITVSLWFKYSSSSGRYANIFTGGTIVPSSKHYWGITRNEQEEEIRYVVWNGQYTVKMVHASYDIWHRTVFSIGAGNCWNIWLDGNVVCDCCETAGLTDQHNQVLLGGYDTGTDGPLIGYIDDVRVFDRVVSKDVIDERGCVSCPAGSSSFSASSSVEDCRCNPGMTGSDGGPCTECVVGKYKTESGDAVCEDCGAQGVGALNCTLMWANR